MSHRAWWLAGLACLPGCGLTAAPRDDVLPPWVVEFQPRDGAPPDCEAGVGFSEPVGPEAVLDGLVVLVQEADLDEGFLPDLDSPPLTKKRAASLVAVEARLEQAGRWVRLAPDAPLQAGQAYWLLVSSAVSDRDHNPLVAELELDERGRVVSPRSHATYRFRVGDAPPDAGADGSDGDPEPAEGGGAEARPGGALRISEVLANPAGEESLGELLEVVAGADGVELAGLLLSDEGEAGAGEPLEACEPGGPTWLPPGGVALVVGRAFVPPADLGAAVLLACNPRDSLTPRGLRNSGAEVLVLKDPAGNVLDRYGGWLDFGAREGCGARRLPLSAPDAEEAWGFPAEEPCATPGRLEPAQADWP